MPDRHRTNPRPNPTWRSPPRTVKTSPLSSMWQRPLAALVAAALLVSAGTPLPALAQVRLPALGESASEDFSVGAERRAGESVMREGRRDPTYLDDPVLLDYLQSLWNPLVAAARASGAIDPDTDQAFAWESFLLSERSVNAFAMPGGFVGVHLGLIALTSTSDQLASVLAHELSHVTQRHIARSISVNQRSSMLGLAAIILGLLAASRGGNIDAANAAIMGGQAAAIQGQLNFSRDMEREADRIGFGLLGGAGFATNGMAEMFTRLDASTRLNDNGGFPYLRSHPLTVDRISEARSRSLLPSGNAGAPPLMHALMQMRARVLMDTSVAGLQRLLGGATTSTLWQDRVAAAYGAAMASSLMKDAPRAEAQALLAQRLAVEGSVRESKAERALGLLLADVRLAGGDAAGALTALASLPQLDRPVAAVSISAATPHSTSASNDAAHERPALLLRAQAAVALHQSQPSAPNPQLRQSTEALQTWLADQPHDPAAWLLLASTAEAIDLHLRSLRAGAEAQAALGDIGGAIDRMRAAQSAAKAPLAQDFIEASVIDARLRQLQAQRRQLALEAREANGGRTPPRDPRDPSDPPQQ